jgi:hypothetical protein
MQRKRRRGNMRRMIWWKKGGKTEERTGTDLKGSARGGVPRTSTKQK